MTLVADISALDFDTVVAEGKRLWQELQKHPLYSVLVEECGMYHDDSWFAPRGAMAIPGWNVEEDGVPNVIEGIKLAVVYSALRGMAPAPSTVDAAFHAALTQTDIMEELEQAIGLRPVHRTIPESGMEPYEPGCRTDALYEAIFGHEPNRRYWMPQSEIDEHVRLISDLFGKVGISIRNGGGVAPDAFDRLRALVRAG